MRSFFVKKPSSLKKTVKLTQVKHSQTVSLAVSAIIFSFKKNLPMHPKTGGKGRINDIAIRYVAKLSGKGVRSSNKFKFV